MIFWVFLIAFLIALLIAVVPVWPYSKRWGYTPAALGAAVLIAFLALAYFGYIAAWFPVGPPYFVEEGPAEGEAEETILQQEVEPGVGE